MKVEVRLKKGGGGEEEIRRARTGEEGADTVLAAPHEEHNQYSLAGKQ